jgi:hypothetical protein
MRKKTTSRTLRLLLPAAVCLLAAGDALGAGAASGTSAITNVEYMLVDPSDGDIEWFYSNGAGGPAWLGEVWANSIDAQGGTDADYNTTPDLLGVIGASASTSLAACSSRVDLTSEELYGDGNVILPPDEWSHSASSGMMFDYFSIVPSDPGSTDPIDVLFSFDYEIHLTGQAEPGAPYYSDAMVSLVVEYGDEFGDWQLVPGGQSFYMSSVSGVGSESDDILLNGELQMIVALPPDVMHAVQISLCLNQYGTIPEPSTISLLACGCLLGLWCWRRRTSR